MLNCTEFMKISHDNSTRIILFLVLPILFGYSYTLIVNYVYGDQLSYRALYESLSYANFSEVFDVAQRHVNATEWLTFYILWLPAVNNVDKDLFIAISNTLMLSLIYLVFRKYRASYFIIFLALTNFYVVVLMTGAERLKFSIILVLLAELVSDRRLKFIFAAASMLAHLQTIIFFVALFFGKYIQFLTESIKAGRVTFKEVGLVIGGIAISIFIYLNQAGGIESKFDSYNDGSLKYFETIQVFFILIAGIFVFRYKAAYISSMLVFVIAVLLIGGQRVNMIAAMVFFYYFLIENKSGNILFFLIMIYFSVKSIPFVSNIFQYGNGFYGV